MNRGDRGRPTALAGQLVRAAAAVGAGIEVEHVLPGEVLEFLHAEGFELVQLGVVHAVAHRLHVAWSSRMKKTLNSEVMTWKCLPMGRKHRKKKKVRSWIAYAAR